MGTAGVVFNKAIVDLILELYTPPVVACPFFTSKTKPNIMCVEWVAISRQVALSIGSGLRHSHWNNQSENKCNSEKSYTQSQP